MSLSFFIPWWIHRKKNLHSNLPVKFISFIFVFKSKDMSKPTAKETVVTVTDYLNSFSSKEKAFIEEMNREHRTLQQSFTKLCLAWLENCASEDYRFDGRNEASHNISKEVVEGFRDAKGTMSNPSEWLPCV